VKIATFNINNINRRLPNLLSWLAAAKPDAVCLQELKAEDGAFPEAALLDAGYNAVWQVLSPLVPASISWLDEE
jgi:exodeoxyribonuclease-3